MAITNAIWPHKPFRYWLRSREEYFFPDLPPLDPPEYTPELSVEEIAFARRVVDQGEEERRRKRVREGRGR